MLKRLFLNYKIRKKRSVKIHTSYAKATRIGLLYNRELFQEEEVRSLQKLLEQDRKIVTLLGFENKPTTDPLLFNRKDISLTGRLNKEALANFVAQPFDFLLSFNSIENINYRYVLGVSEALCKIGFETDYYRDLLQMSLQLEKDKPHALEEMGRYLKMIA